MRRFLQLFPLALYMIAAGLMALQGIVPVAECPRLHGEPDYARQSPPGYSFERWMAGAFQKKFSAWHTKAFGFRPLLIRYYNEGMFTVLRDVAVSSRSRIFRGRGEWLYSWGFIAPRMAHQPVDDPLLKRRVLVLRDAYDLLRARGVAMVVVIAPSKANVRPDMLPYRFRHATPSSSAIHQRMVELFDQYNIPYLDFDSDFARRRKSDTSFDPFPRTGIHWNYLAAGTSLERVFRVCERQLGVDIQRSVPKGVISRETISTDRDLLDMLNLAAPERRTEPSPYPQYHTYAPPGARRTSILFVGDSFASQMIRIIADQQMCERTTYWSYFRKEKVVGSTYRRHFRTSPIDKPSIDWNALIERHDAVIIEFNVAFCRSQQEDGFGWGFADLLSSSMPSTGIGVD